MLLHGNLFQNHIIHSKGECGMRLIDADYFKEQIAAATLKLEEI